METIQLKDARNLGLATDGFNPFGNWRRLKILDQESILYLEERKGSGNLDSVGAEGLACETCCTGHL
jgi:hypothetical protein